jgi:hypothetical protein
MGGCCISDFFIGAILREKDTEDEAYRRFGPTVETWLIDRHLRQPTSCPATSGSQSETQADDLECFCCPSIVRLETQRSKNK